MSAPKTSSIYAIRSKTTGRVYIGRSQDPYLRMQQHFQHLKRGDRYCGTDAFQEDYERYGADDFEAYILEQGVEPQRFQERESYWIDRYKATDPRYGYNKDKMEYKKIPFVPGLPPNISESESM